MPPARDPKAVSRVGRKLYEDGPGWNSGTMGNGRRGRALPAPVTPKRGPRNRGWDGKSKSQRA